MNESMKKRKKMLMHHYRRRSRSNTSLSQLLSVGKSIASYKRCIKVLAEKNHNLAVELNFCRLENSRLDNQVKNYSIKNHHWMFAHEKLNEMAKTILKLTTDMSEVRACLDGNWAGDTPDKPAYKKLEIKLPTVSVIEEASVISSENESLIREESSGVLETPNQTSAEAITEPAISSELPPILFVTGAGEKDKEKTSSSSRRENSRKSNVSSERSLTPQLDVDLTIFNKRRTSSRRQTQVFFPDKRNTRSSGKSTSSGRRTASDLRTTPVRRSTPPATPDEIDPMEAVDTEIDRTPENAFSVNLKQISSKNANVAAINLSPNLNSEVNHTNTNFVLPLPHFPVKNAPQKNAQVNSTVILCEDMELTEIIPCIAPIRVSEFKKKIDDIAFENEHEKKNDKVTDLEKKSELDPQNNNVSQLLTAGAGNAVSENVHISPCEQQQNNNPTDNDVRDSSPSRRENSRKLNVSDDRSLTPQLDIDLNIFNRRRTSSSRQAQVFPDKRKPKSVEMTRQSDCRLDKQTRQNDDIRDSIATRHNHSVDKEKPMSFCEQNKDNNSKESDLDDITSPLLNAKRRRKPVSYKDAFLSDESDENSTPVKEVMHKGKNSKSKTESILKPKSDKNVSSVSTDYPCMKKASSGNSSIVSKNDPVCDLVVSENAPIIPSKQKENKNMIDGDIRDYFSTSHNHSVDKVKPISFCEQFEDNLKKDDLDGYESPFLVKSKRQRKPVNYRNSLSSDEPDQGSPPIKKLVDKGQNSKDKIESILQAKSGEKVSSISADCLSTMDSFSGKDNTVSQNAFSVYELDVSNSQMKKSQKLKLDRKKAAEKKKEDTTKLLLQKCSVKKLKCGNYKFSKSETAARLKKNNQLTTAKPVLELSPTHDALNTTVLNVKNNAEKESESAHQGKNIRKSILVKNKCTDNAEEDSNVRHEQIKRVSFAATSKCTTNEILDVFSNSDDETEIYTFSNMRNILDKGSKSEAEIATDNVSDANYATAKINVPCLPPQYAISSAIEQSKSKQSRCKNNSTVKSKKETEKFLHDKKVRHASISEDEIQKISNSKNILDTGNNVETNKKDEKELLNSYEISISSSPSQYVISSVNERSVNKQSETPQPIARVRKSILVKNKHSDNTEDNSNIRHQEAMTPRQSKRVSFATTIATSKIISDENLYIRELLNSDDTEVYTLPNCENILNKGSEPETEAITNKKMDVACAAAEINVLFPSSQSDNTEGKSSISHQKAKIPILEASLSSISEQSKNKHKISKGDLAAFKRSSETTRTPSKLGKLSLKANKISQKGLLDGTEREEGGIQQENTNASIPAKDSILDEFSHGNSKENVIPSDHILENLQDGLYSNSKTPSDASLANHCKNSSNKHQSRAKNSKASLKKDNALQKRSLFRQTPNSSLKIGNERISGCSPVLKDLNNVEETNGPRRRSRAVVSYKEPSLHKKMRRQ